MTTIEPIIIPIVRSPEQIAQDIKASHDSVDLILRIVADNERSDNIYDTIDRNVRHLRSCLTLTHIIENATPTDKSAFADAATLGENWIF